MKDELKINPCLLGVIVMYYPGAWCIRRLDSTNIWIRLFDAVMFLPIVLVGVITGGVLTVILLPVTIVWWVILLIIKAINPDFTL